MKFDVIIHYTVFGRNNVKEVVAMKKRKVIKRTLK